MAQPSRVAVEPGATHWTACGAPVREGYVRRVPIDLNADLGAGCGGWSDETDGPLLRLATSVAIPCGAHAGDPVSMQSACQAAAATGLTVGALVGYLDPVGRGERFIDSPADDLTAEIIYQLGALDGIALTEGTRISFVRPSRALFDAVHTDRHHAWAVINAVLDYDPSLAVVGLRGGELLRTAQRHGLTCVAEFHPHRLLTANGALGSVRPDPARAAERALAAARCGDYATIKLPDEPALRPCAEAVRGALVDAGVSVGPFARAERA